MRYSSAYIPTLKENPADADTASHRLLTRAGMIRKLASGLYTYLPLGLKLLDKISRVVREEMNAAGFQEILMPAVQPAELWKETGRWDQYGKELLRFKDRNDHDYCLGPTHEEVVTDLARGEARSYRRLPLRLYQIQTKFRDEIRPRFGLMRGREFIMKDAYSFDANQEGAEESYQLMRDAYDRIFSRLGLRFRAVEADSGSIGGNFSHEYMVMADAGEDSVAVCENCEYAANVERAEIAANFKPDTSACPPIERVATPGAHTAAEVCEALDVPPQKLIKTLLFDVDGHVVAVLTRGDREVNPVKLKKFLNARSAELAPHATVEALTQAPVGFAGPVGLTAPIYADNELIAGTDYVTGANRGDEHLFHVDLARDAKIVAWADLREITPEDPCPRCGGKIRVTRGIEVGHVFMLGLKYSEPMGAVFLDENGEEKYMIQGCYGIGISRVAAAAIEQNHDDKGAVFPPEISPIDCVILNLDPRDEKVSAAAENAYRELGAAGLDCLLDDRAERPGVKFNDADLLGAPAQIIFGARGVARGVAEVKDRRSGEKSELPLENFGEAFKCWREGVLAGWQKARELA